jgi:hypothetical protein
MIVRLVTVFAAIAAISILVLLTNAELRGSFLSVTGLDDVFKTLPTALEGSPFPEGTAGVVLADFRYIDAGASRVEANLEREFVRAGIPVIRVHHPFTDETEARRVAQIYRANLAVWGEGALGGVLIDYAMSTDFILRGGGDWIVDTPLDQFIILAEDQTSLQQLCL